MVINITMYPCIKFQLIGKVQVLGPNVAKNMNDKNF